MNEQQYDHVRLQVDFLLRENRRLKRIGLAVATLMLVVMTAGAFRDNIADAVRARRFVLMDEKDNPSALLSMLDGHPALSLFGKDQKIKLQLGLPKDRPYLVLYDCTFRESMYVMPLG